MTGHMDGETSATVHATFLFTDMEGSTQLLRSHRSEYASILSDHHRLLRAISGVTPSNASPTITQLDPQTGTARSIRVQFGATPLAWSEGYGDLWMSNFEQGTVTRRHAATGFVEHVDVPAKYPGFLVVAGDVVWVGDWGFPQVIRVSAVGPHKSHVVSFPARYPLVGGVWCVAASPVNIWATVPRDRALWRIDPRTVKPSRIDMPYLPSCVAASADDIWVTVRRG